MVDTFSGDAIPAHMATDEAFDLYRERLAPGGMLAIHISNWQYDLFPLCKAQMKRTGMVAQGMLGAAEPSQALLGSSWVFFSEEPVSLVYPERLARPVNWALVPDAPSVTDEKGSFLRFRPQAAR